MRVAQRVRTPRLREWTTRSFDGRVVPVTQYDLELVLGAETVPGTLVLDAKGYVLEQRLGSQRLLRVE